MYTLYSMQRSGNSYKVRLALARLGIPYRLVEVDILKGESRTPEFLSKNPNGQVPLLEVAPNRHLAESNAILWYVAIGSTLAPEDRIARAEALQWMFFEQYSHEPFIATSRFWRQHKPDSPAKSALLESKRDGGWAALKIMENHLAKNDFFVSGYTIADIALFAYTHVSHEGGFPLGGFAKIQAWIERVKSQPAFVSMV